MKADQKHYNVFLEDCIRYVHSTLETAMDERRHDQTNAQGGVVTHLASALSVGDMHAQVASRCAEGAKIPSMKWLSYQFWPRKPLASTAKLYKGYINMKFMVQPRQFRATHPDSHYASALFR